VELDGAREIAIRIGSIQQESAVVHNAFEFLTEFSSPADEGPAAILSLD